MPIGDEMQNELQNKTVSQEEGLVAWYPARSCPTGDGSDSDGGNSELSFMDESDGDDYPTLSQSSRSTPDGVTDMRGKSSDDQESVVYANAKHQYQAGCRDEEEYESYFAGEDFCPGGACDESRCLLCTYPRYLQVSARTSLQHICMNVQLVDLLVHTVFCAHPTRGYQVHR